MEQRMKKIVIALAMVFAFATVSFAQEPVSPASPKVAATQKKAPNKTKAPKKTKSAKKSKSNQPKSPASTQGGN